MTARYFFTGAVSTGGERRLPSRILAEQLRFRGRAKCDRKAAEEVGGTKDWITRALTRAKELPCDSVPPILRSTRRKFNRRGSPYIVAQWHVSRIDYLREHARSDNYNPILVEAARERE
jgi:hypothetical protein